MDLVALWHVGSSRTRDQTRVPCIGRWILNHCATREAPNVYFFSRITFSQRELEIGIDVVKINFSSSFLCYIYFLTHKIEAKEILSEV